MPIERALVSGLLGLAAIALTPGCTPVALQPVTSTGLVIYTKGASQHTARVQLALPPNDVYSGMLAIVGRMPELTVVNQDDRKFFLEVVNGKWRLSGQATDLGRGETLLFVWADAGSSGQSGRELALDAVKLLCTELGVECSVQDF